MEFCYNDEVSFITDTFLNDLMTPVVGIMALYSLTRKKGEKLAIFVGLILAFVVFLIFAELLVCRSYEFYQGNFGRIYLGVFGIITMSSWFGKYSPGKIIGTQQVAVDGNNMLGQAGWDFNIVVKLYRSMIKSGLKPMLFFDNAIYRNLKENELIWPGKSIPQALATVFDCDLEDIIVSEQGEKVDPLIIEYAIKNQCSVLSNDKFDKVEDADFAGPAAQLRNAGMTYSVRKVGNELIVQGVNRSKKKYRFWWWTMIVLFVVMTMFSSMPFELDELMNWRPIWW